MHLIRKCIVCFIEQVLLIKFSSTVMKWKRRFNLYCDCSGNKT